MKVCIISSSPRRKGNSALLCEQFTKGAKEAGDCVYFVVDSAAEENAKMCVDELRALIGPDHKIQREPICAVIASHTGLGSVAFQYCKKVKGAD